MHVDRIESQAPMDVCIVGMGYVGLTLAAALVNQGLKVIGCESNPESCRLLNKGQPHVQEPGVGEALQRYLGHSLIIDEELPPTLPAVVVVCVGTPIDPVTQAPDLRQLEDAINAIAAHASPATLIIVRSTVPVGTCRNIVFPLLQQGVPEPLLAFCPERTIQGKALQELRSLPQIVGGLNDEAVVRATMLFDVLAPQVIAVSSLEAAEFIKLICNAHTDLIYGFGNEVALCAEALDLDANELIASANLDYPRPDLSRPGFVGGGCLSKDPYLLIHSAKTRGYLPTMVQAARQLNEMLPLHVGERILSELRAVGRDPRNATIFVSGFAYKGQPETDDVRGTPAAPLLEFLSHRVELIRGHDFVVSDAQIAAMGAQPVTLEDGFVGADAVVVLNNHLEYKKCDVNKLVVSMNPSAVFYDAWGIFADRLDLDRGIRYVRLGGN